MNSTFSSPCSSPPIFQGENVSSLNKQNAAAFLKELECPLCLSTFVNPRVLKCQHCFCLKCLYSHWSSGSQLFSPNDRLWHIVLCPLKCEENTTVIGGLEQLPHNYIVSKLSSLIRKGEIERFERDGRSSSELGLSCEWCSNMTEVKPCMSCLSFVCAECMSPSTLHHRLCTSLSDLHGTEKNDEGEMQKKKIENGNDEPTLRTVAEQKEALQVPSFYSENDALDCLFLELHKKMYHVRGSREEVTSPKVLSIRSSTHPFTEYSVAVRHLPGEKIYRLYLYRSQTLNVPITTNSYWLSKCKGKQKHRLNTPMFPLILLRLVAFFRSVVHQTRKDLSVFLQELINCAHDLVPSVTKGKGDNVVDQRCVVIAPVGYQAFAYHILWQAQHHLFMIYHMLYPLISRALYSQLFLVESIFRGNVASDPGRCPFSSSEAGDSKKQGQNGMEEGMDTFAKANLHRTWSVQVELLHGALGELAEAIEHVEDACGEVKNIMINNHALCYQEGSSRCTKFSMELPNISLRFYLNKNQQLLNCLSECTTSLLKNIAALRDVSARIAADSLKELLGIRGRSQEAEAIAQSDHELQSLQLQILYLCWGNHRLHYTILSGIIGRSVMEERSFPFLSSMDMLLETCYHSPPHPYEPLNRNLLSCIRDFIDSSPLRGIWLLLPSLREDLQQQHIDGQLAIHHNCQVTCYSTVMLDRLDAYCIIQPPMNPQAATADSFTACPEESIRIMRIVGSLPFEAFNMKEKIRYALWLKDLNTFLACFSRMDMCLTLLYYFQDRGGIPQTSIFGRMGKSTASLDTTFPSVESMSELLSSSPFHETRQRRTSTTGSAFDDEGYMEYSLLDFLSFMEEEMKNTVNKPKAERQSIDQKLNTEKDQNGSCEASKPPREQRIKQEMDEKAELTTELTKCIHTLQGVALSNWLDKEKIKDEKLPFDIEASRTIQVPYYHIYFSINKNDVCDLC